MELNRPMPPTRHPIKKNPLNELLVTRRFRVGLLMFGLAVVGIVFPDSRVQAILAGAITFAVNAYAVFYMAGRLLRGSYCESSNGSSTRGTGFLILALTVKIFGLGTCTYLSLIVAQFSPYYFVGGAVSVLVAFALWRLVEYRDMRLRTGIE